MRKLTRIVLFIFFGSVLLLAAGGVYLVKFFDPNAHQAFLIDQFKRATGRDLTLAGPLEIDFLPKLRLHAGPLSISNAPGFAAPTMLAVAEVELAVATWPLLRGRVEMETLKLHGARLNLERDTAGVTNWDDLRVGDTARAPSRAQADQVGAFLLGGVDIVDAHVTWRDARAQQEITLAEVNAKSGPLTFGAPVALTLQAKVVAAKPALTGDVVLLATATYDTSVERYGVEPLKMAVTLYGKTLPGGKAEFTGEAVLALDLARGEAQVRKLKIEGLGYRASGEFTLDHLDLAQPGARGHFELAGADLALLFRAFDLPAATQIAGLRERSFEFQTVFDRDVASGKLAVPTFDLKILGASLNGVVSGERANTATPALNGKISARGADLPALILLTNQILHDDAQSARGLSKALAGVKDRAFSLETEFAADLAAGQLELPRFHAELLGNEFNGALKSRGGSAGKPSVSGQLTARGHDLTALALAIGTLQGMDSEGLAALSTVFSTRQDRSFIFKTTVDADLGTDQIALPAVTATIFGNELTGSFSATNATSGQPAIAGELAAQGPDLPALLALFGGLHGAGSALPGLAESLTAAPDKSFTFGTKFALAPKEGRLDLPSFGARALGLTFSGTLNATAFNHPRGGVVNGHLALEGSKLASLLTALGQPELAKSVHTLKFEAGLEGNAQTLAMRPFVANVEVRGPAGAAPVDLKLTGDAKANLARETLSIKNLALTGLGLNLKGDLEATEIKSALKYTGQISAPNFNLREVLATLNKPITGLADPAALTQVGFDTTVQGTAHRYALSGLTLKLDETTLKGDFAVDDTVGRAVNFKLIADRLNADRYLAPKNATRAAPVTPEAAAVGAAQLPLAVLRKIKMDGKLAIGNLQFAGAKLSKVTVALQGHDGKLSVDPVSADLYGGRYTGVIGLDATGKIPTLMSNSTLAKVAIEPLLVDTTGKSAFAGAVNFEAKLSARGSESSQLLHSLNGQASFAITDGVFRGVDAPAVLRAAELIIESKSLQPVPRGGTTQFQSLTGSLDIQNGALYNHDLQLDGAGFKVAGDGLLANLNDDTIKYDARIAVDQGSLEQGAAHYMLGDYVIPIRCRGPISGTSCLPDFGELAKVAATKALRDQVEKKLDKSLGGAGKALKNLLKF